MENNFEEWMKTWCDICGEYYYISEMHIDKYVSKINPNAVGYICPKCYAKMKGESEVN